MWFGVSLTLNGLLSKNIQWKCFSFPLCFTSPSISRFQMLSMGRLPMMMKIKRKSLNWQSWLWLYYCTSWVFSSWATNYCSFISKSSVSISLQFGTSSMYCCQFSFWQWFPSTLLRCKLRGIKSLTWSGQCIVCQAIWCGWSFIISWESLRPQVTTHHQFQ